MCRFGRNGSHLSIPMVWENAATEGWEIARGLETDYYQPCLWCTAMLSGWNGRGWRMYGRIGLFCIWNELLHRFCPGAVSGDKRQHRSDEKAKMWKNRIIPAEVLFWRRRQCKLLRWQQPWDFPAGAYFLSEALLSTGSDTGLFPCEVFWWGCLLPLAFQWA